jgi:hypothetical protein
MCSYEIIFNSFGKLIDSYGLETQWIWWQACGSAGTGIGGANSHWFFWQT